MSRSAEEAYNRYHADRLRHGIYVVVVWLGVLMAFGGLVLYAATSPPLGDWDTEVLTAATVMLLGGGGLALLALNQSDKDVSQ